MLQLLERLRQLKTSGRPVEVLLFDSEAPEAALRDERMAAQIIARRQARPEATVLLLMGNLHARKVLGNPFDGNAQYRWLTSRLPGATVSLIARAPAGSAWVCGGMTADSCGADLIGADPLAKGTAAVVLGLSNDGAFDGTFELPSMTASPPAAFAEVIASFDATLAALKTGPKAMVAQAMRQYDAKDFAACAQTLSALERPTADQLYSRACCQALAGRKDAAFADLKAALAAGFTDEKTLATDPDLESLRSDQRWRTVN